MLLVASKRLEYGGKFYNAGEQFNATKEDAGLLTTLRLAQYQPEPVIKETFHTVSLVKSIAENDGGDHTPKTKPKRKYQRRDKVADEQAEAIADDNGMAVNPKKPKRQYRRRDMTAENTSE